MPITCDCSAVPNRAVRHGFLNRADPGSVRYGWRAFTLCLELYRTVLNRSQHGSNSRVNVVLVASEYFQPSAIYK